jgi:hypothetical protein
LQDDIDILFLRGEVLRFKDILERLLTEEQYQRELLGLGGVSRGGNWRGCVQYLRVIMCLTQDNIKLAFLRRADVHSCQESDARNSENRNGCAISLRCVALLFTCTNSCLYFVFIYRQLTEYKSIANLWKSEDFNPIAPASQYHYDLYWPLTAHTTSTSGDYSKLRLSRLQTALR